MVTPYDWQEGIGRRAEYIENKLSQGAPVLGVSLAAGIVFFTYRRQSRKLYEIYDRLMFGGLGQQADVESLRIAALEFASREGFNRSEEDVTIQRLAVALSAPFKSAFADFSMAPIIARVALAEVGDCPDADRYYAIDYDGDYRLNRGHVVVAGSEELTKSLGDQLIGVDSATDPADAVAVLDGIWRTAIEGDEAIEGLRPEALFLARSGDRVNRFEALTPED